MAKIGKRDVFRMTLDLPLSDMGRIEKLQELTGSSTHKSIFDMALAVTMYVVECLQNGERFNVVTPGGEIKEIIFPLRVNRLKKRKKIS
ncbi:MAG: hypothetical protein V1668_01430 [Patescibacteria group bacterium]